MEQNQDIYVISDDMRRAIVAIIGKGVHPNVSFEQIRAVTEYLENLQPAQVMQGLPENRRALEDQESEN